MGGSYNVSIPVCAEVGQWCNRENFKFHIATIIQVANISVCHLVNPEIDVIGYIFVELFNARWNLRRVTRIAGLYEWDGFLSFLLHISSSSPRYQHIHTLSILESTKLDEWGILNECPDGQ